MMCIESPTPASIHHDRAYMYISGEKYKYGVGTIRTNTSKTISSTDLQNTQGFKN